MDKKGLPLDLLILVLIVMPVCVAIFFGRLAFKNMAPSLFKCQRCEREFQTKAWRKFPRRCPLCKAQDWNG